MTTNDSSIPGKNAGDNTINKANDEERDTLLSGSITSAMSGGSLVTVDTTQAELKLSLDEKIKQLRAANCSVEACKDVLAQGRLDIYQCFLDGVSAAALISLQTRLTDMILLELWEGTIVGELKPSDNQQLALLAVGGYGRAELHPYSDIDIAILVSKTPDKALAEAISAFITVLWDIGFDIGHSVRTVQQASDVASEDLSIVTNLMEARLLTGSEALFEKLNDAISPEKMWASAKFFHAKMEEQNLRREKFQNNAYRLEPNIKESSGGLRDIQTVFWICQRHFGTREFEELVTTDILNRAEFNVLTDGLDTLWRIRFLLHHITNKREDRLLFDFQREIAHAWGFTDDTENRCIEELMQLFYRNAMRLQRLNEIILQGIGGLISGVTAGTKPVAINSRFQVRNGFLEIKHDRVFVNYPPALLELFLLYGETPEVEKIRSNTVRAIGSHLDLINDSFRRDPQVRDMFLQIFRSPMRLTRKIRLMSSYGVLAAYLPAFDKIVGRMQYDLFHIYTVDEHTTRVIRNLRRFALPEFADELPHCSDIMGSIEKPELLYLTGLFHDIAKGRGGDHSELGADDAQRFGESHGLDPADTGLIAWVVRNHLLMSTTAQRRDISDVDVIREFAESVSSMKHLNYLYLLTVADVRATNPDLWNSFKQNLLRELYESTRRWLRRGLDNPLDKEEVLAQKKRQALDDLSSSEFSPKVIRELWEQLGDAYYLRYQPVEIARHTINILAHPEPSLPLVKLRPANRRGSTEVFIYMPDHPNLIALVTGVLGSQNLDIQSANITTTSSGYALDAFYVLDENGRIIREESRHARIRDALLKALVAPDEATFAASQPMPRLLKHFDVEPQIEFDQIANEGFTSLYINAMDQPGVLSDITRALGKHNIQIHSASIVTLGERIEDMFFITDQTGNAVSDETTLNSLKDSLLKIWQGNS